MEPNSWPAPPPPAGWYADPDDDRNIRYWDGSTWTGNASGLAITVGLCLILLALFFGFIAATLLSDGFPGWEADPHATQLAETIWRIFFGAMLTLCVIAFILGILSLARPATRPRYSAIAGIFMIAVGLVGCILGFIGTKSIDPMIGYVGSGFLFALGGAITTLLSAVALAQRRRSSRRRVTAGPQPVGLPPTRNLS